MLIGHLVNLHVAAMQRLRRSEWIWKHVENAQRNQKLYYNQKHAVGDLFTVGSLVLKKDFRRKKQRGGKMDFH